MLRAGFSRPVHDVGVAAIAGSLVAEQIALGASLVLVGVALAATIVHLPGWAIASLIVLGALTGGAVIAGFLVRRSRLSLPSVSERLARPARDLIGGGLRVLHDPREFAIAVVLGTGSWIAQIAGIYWTLDAFGLPHTAAVAGSVFLVSTLVGVFPIMPGNVGVFQLAVAGVLASSFGVSAASGAAFAIGLQATEGRSAPGLARSSCWLRGSRSPTCETGRRWRRRRRSSCARSPPRKARWHSPHRRRAVSSPAVILAIDQGTTGTTCLVVDDAAAVVGRGIASIASTIPQPGWVEHDPEEIWATRRRPPPRRRWRRPASRAADLRGDRHHQPARDDDRCGIGDRPAGGATRSSGRTAARPTLCEQLPRREPDPRRAPAWSSIPTSRPPSSPGCWKRRRRASPASGDWRPGPSTAWLIWKLTGGERARHRRHQRVADAAAATSRTLDWDDELLALFGVPRAMLPEIVPVERRARRGADRAAGERAADRRGGRRPAGGAVRPGLPRARAGEVHLRHRLLPAGPTRRAADPPPHGLLRTAAAQPGEPTTRWRGRVFVAGAAVQWLRDGLGLLAEASDSERLAARAGRQRRRLFRARP